MLEPHFLSFVSMSQKKKKKKKKHLYSNNHNLPHILLHARFNYV